MLLTLFLVDANNESKFPNKRKSEPKCNKTSPEKVRHHLAKVSDDNPVLALALFFSDY